MLSETLAGGIWDLRDRSKDLRAAHEKTLGLVQLGEHTACASSRCRHALSRLSFEDFEKDEHWLAPTGL
jgi:hypothetical protein